VTPAAAALRNLRRDWRAWGVGERITALAILAASAMSLPLMMVLTGS
jgi:hypothetical protein